MARTVSFFYLVLILFPVESFSAPPEAPVLSFNTSGTDLTIEWSAVAGATGYTLFYAPYPNAETVGNLDLGDTLTISGDLAVGSAFYVAVQAYNQDGNSELSNIESFIIGGDSSSEELVESLCDPSFCEPDLRGIWASTSNSTDQIFITQWGAHFDAIWKSNQAGDSCIPNDFIVGKSSFRGEIVGQNSVVEISAWYCDSLEEVFLSVTLKIVLEEDSYILQIPEFGFEFKKIGNSNPDIFRDRANTCWGYPNHTSNGGPVDTWSEGCHDENGLKHGRWYFFDSDVAGYSDDVENPWVFELIEFSHGQRHGLSESYSTNSVNDYCTGLYSEGRRIGTHRCYYHSGNLSAEFEYDDEGNLISQTNYDDGVEDEDDSSGENSGLGPNNTALPRIHNFPENCNLQTGALIAQADAYYEAYLAAVAQVNAGTATVAQANQLYAQYEIIDDLAYTTLQTIGCG